MKIKNSLNQAIAAALVTYLFCVSNALATYTIQDDLVVEDSLEVQGNDGGVFRGTHGSGSLLATGQGTRMIWYPNKSAFRAGAIVGTGASDSWDSTNIGSYSVAFGRNTKASGYGSLASGSGAEATHIFSVALGSSDASGFGATAVGSGNTSSATGAFAAGEGNVASGFVSAAFGKGTRAQGHSQFVIGYYNVAQGSSGTWVDEDDIFIIGNGEDHNNRSNALSVKKNGDAHFAGTVRIEPSGDIGMGQFTSSP